VPLPESVLTISEIAVVGTAIPEDRFPRVRARRIVLDDVNGDPTLFSKPSAAHLDYSIDLSTRLETTETVIGAYAWSSAPTSLVVTWVYYAMKGALAYAAGGVDGSVFDLYLSIKTSTGRVFQVSAQIETTGDANEADTNYVPPALLGSGDLSTEFLTDTLGAPIAPPLTDLGGWT